jgi:hypothetical protein
MFNFATFIGALYGILKWLLTVLAILCAIKYLRNK